MYIVPTGLLVTLHYNVHGTLDSITKGFDGTEELGEEFIESAAKSGIVPYSIKLTGGNTTIWGVIHSDKFTASNALLPMAEYDRIIQDVLNGTRYKFYVGNIQSGAMTLVNPTAMNSWAKLNGFNPMPTWIVPTDASDNILESFINSSRNIPFVFPLIAGFIIYQDGNAPYFRYTHLTTAKVVRTKNYTNDNGYLMVDVICADGSDDTHTSVAMHYADAVTFGVQKGSQIILDEGSVVWCSSSSVQGGTHLTRRIDCKACGKLLDVPVSGPMTCTDPHCISLLYPKVVNFCRVLDLDCITKSTFDKYVRSGDLTILPDLLLLPAYKKVKISKSIWEIIYAVMITDVGIGSQWLLRLCNLCNNNYPTIRYYFENPVQMYTELDMQPSKRLLSWIEDPRNLLELDAIISSDQVDTYVTNKIMKFDGPPIFRDKTIYITGGFLHGSDTDIIAIFNSYGAVVVTDFDEYVQCIVVGDTKEGIDGGAIASARAFNIPVFSESEFFSKYDIDSDLEKYLS